MGVRPTAAHAGRRTRSCYSSLFLLSIAAWGSVGAQSGSALTLDQAVQLAEQQSPSLRNAQAELQALEAQLGEASALLWNNPELSAGIDRRRFPEDGTATEWNLGIAQTLELAGQPRHRREAAQLALAAARETYNEIYLHLRTDVTQRFVRVAALQDRVAAEEELLELVDGLSQIVTKRFKAGEDTRLDANLAAVEADRARNQLGQLREELIEARRELAAALQLPAARLPEAEGGIPLRAQPYTLEQLVTRADERPLIRSLRHREGAARSRLSLERAGAYPDLTLGVGTGREGLSGERERFIGLSASLPLPLFKRNRAAIGRAAADLTSAQVEREVTERDTRTAVIALWERLQSLRERAALLRDATLPRLEENQRLARRSFEVGEIGTAEVLLATRQLIELRRDTIEAQAELALTIAQIEQVAGWLPAPSRP
jgi:cobalt-zinc-cadmium efflux system outer membrane protein